MGAWGPRGKNRAPGNWNACPGFRTKLREAVCGTPKGMPKTLLSKRKQRQPKRNQV